MHNTIRPAHYRFGSTADLAEYCEGKAEQAHRARMSAKTQRDGLVWKATKDTYADLASLIRDAEFTAEALLLEIREWFVNEVEVGDTTLQDWADRIDSALPSKPAAMREP